MNWRPSERLAAGVLSLLLWFLVAASALNDVVPDQDSTQVLLQIIVR